MWVLYVYLFSQGFMIDKEISKLIDAETKRQNEQLNLIASENYVSAAVMKATGSVFTNKYSEGYPHARYYAGQENVDKLEILCQQRALKMMKLSAKERGVNVQPLSGSPANLAVYM